MWFGRKTNFSTSLALIADHSRPFIGDHQKSNYWDELLSFPALKLEKLHMSMLIVDMASFSSVFLPSEVRAVTALGPGTPGAHPRINAFRCVQVRGSIARLVFTETGRDAARPQDRETARFIFPRRAEGRTNSIFFG